MSRTRVSARRDRLLDTAPADDLHGYDLTTWAGAALLFVVQPVVGKMILPLLGGTPAVWSTCMVFFQAALLGGYAYAHASTARLSIFHKMILHLALIAVPLAMLPLAVNPAPLLQKWFTHTGHPAARDPYFLCAASNLGSMLALLGYPTPIEPRQHLKGDAWLTQTRLWSLGYLGA